MVQKSPKSCTFDFFVVPLRPNVGTDHKYQGKAGKFGHAEGDGDRECDAGQFRIFVHEHQRSGGVVVCG